MGSKSVGRHSESIGLGSESADITVNGHWAGEVDTRLANLETMSTNMDGKLDKIVGCMPSIKVRLSIMETKWKMVVGTLLFSSPILTGVLIQWLM